MPNADLHVVVSDYQVQGVRVHESLRAFSGTNRDNHEFKTRPVMPE
jgi:hypothetical protein